MRIDLANVIAKLREMADDLRECGEHGRTIDEDWLLAHQPQMAAFTLEEVLGWLRLVQVDPSRLDEFFQSTCMAGPEVDRA